MSNLHWMHKPDYIQPAKGTDPREREIKLTGFRKAVYNCLMAFAMVGWIALGFLAVALVGLAIGVFAGTIEAAYKWTQRMIGL